MNIVSYKFQRLLTIFELNTEYYKNSTNEIAMIFLNLKFTQSVNKFVDHVFKK